MKSVTWPGVCVNSGRRSHPRPSSQEPYQLDTMSMPHDFEWEPTEEPHATRRKLILAKYAIHSRCCLCTCRSLMCCSLVRYPQVRELYGPHWLNKYVMTATVLLQVWSFVVV